MQGRTTLLLYYFLVMNAPAIFERVVTEHFGYNGFVTDYIDEVVIISLLLRGRTAISWWYTNKEGN